jgi:hypothetical protein
MHVGGCVKVSTWTRRQAEERARELGMEKQFRREKLRRKAKELRRGLQRRVDVLKRISTEEVVRLRGWGGLFDCIWWLCGGRARFAEGGCRGKVGLLALVLSVGGHQACAGVAAAVLSLFIVSPRAMYMSI